MKNIFIFLTLLPSFCFGAKSPEHLAELYSQAYLDEDIDKILALNLDVWDQCKRPEFNDRIRVLMRSEPFDSKQFFTNYELELRPVTKNTSEAKTRMDEIEEYPVEPTHIMLFKISSGLSSKAVIEKDNEWYFAHPCAGENAKEVIELLEKEISNKFKNENAASGSDGGKTRRPF